MHRIDSLKDYTFMLDIMPHIERLRKINLIKTKKREKLSPSPLSYRLSSNRSLFFSYNRRATSLNGLS